VSYLLIIAGLIIGISVFFYLVSTFSSVKEKIAVKKQGPPIRPDVRPESVQTVRATKRAPGARTCPLCGSELTKYEALYASHVKNGNENKIMIFGCRYCYRPDEDPDRVRKSDY